MTTGKLMEYFSEDDIRKKGDLRFDDFSRLYRKLLETPTVKNYSDLLIELLY